MRTPTKQLVLALREYAEKHYAGTDAPIQHVLEECAARLEEYMKYIRTRFEEPSQRDPREDPF